MHAQYQLFIVLIYAMLLLCFPQIYTFTVSSSSLLGYNGVVTMLQNQTKSGGGGGVKSRSPNDSTTSVTSQNSHMSSRTSQHHTNSRTTTTGATRMLNGTTRVTSDSSVRLKGKK